MTITQYRVLLAVLEEPSFAAAGERLAMSQSAVSHALGSLEREIGAPLVERGPNRPTRPTEFGASLLPDIRELVGRADRIADRASDYVGLASGRLRIASVESIAGRLLPTLLASFRARYPRIEVGLLEGADWEVREWLRAGVADVGFLAMPLDDLVVEPFVSDGFAAVMPAGHRLAGAARVSAADLVGEAYVMSKSGCEPLVLDWFKPAGPTVEYEVRTVEAMLGFIREGLGVAIMPGLTHPDDRAKLAIVPIDPPAARHVVVARAAKREPTPAVRAFIDLAVAFGRRVGRPAGTAPPAAGPAAPEDEALATSTSSI